MASGAAGSEEGVKVVAAVELAELGEAAFSEKISAGEAPEDC